MKYKVLPHKIKPVLATSVAATVIALSGFSVAHAQFSPRTVSITNPKIEATLSPGATTEGKLAVINDSDTSLSFKASLYDFIVQDNLGTPEILKKGTIANLKYSASNWVAVAPDTFTVGAHKRFDFMYYIKIPKNASPGGHYAAIVYQPYNNDKQLGSGASVNAQVATLIYIAVPGNVKESAILKQFNAPAFSEYGPIPITTEITNSGDIHFTPKGTITLKDMLGRVIEESQLPDQNIFPGGVSLLFHNKLGQEFMLGRYQANLTANYGSLNSDVLVGSVYFWVFPWRATVVAILLIVGLILSIKYYKKDKTRKTQEQEVITEP